MALRLQFFVLSEDPARTLAEQTFGETRFVGLSGNPKSREQVGFFELVRPVPTFVQFFVPFFAFKLQRLVFEDGRAEGSIPGSGDE